MAKISGCYRWNDTLSVVGNSFLLDMAVSVNGARYVSAMIVSSTDADAMVALFDENEEMILIYASDAGWFKAVHIYDDNPILVQSDLWQTWDFGEDQDVPDDFYAYLTANASPVASAEAVNLSYGGRIIASVDGGQSATLHCKGKSMSSDLLLLVPRKRSASGGGGAEMNVAFGDTAPDDTGKLWIKTAEPESVGVKMNFDFVGNEQLQAATLSLPSNVYQSCAAAVGKKIYVFGGSNSYSDKIYVYDTETNGIEQSSATLPSAVNGAACAAVGKRIYIFGGRTTSGSSGKSRAIHVFDTETSTFETLSVQLPEDRFNAPAAAVGNKIYIFGGSYYNNGEKASRTVYLFNAESNAITSLAAKLPTNAYSVGAVAVGSKIYVFGGYDGSTRLNSISIFDTEMQTLTALEDVKLPIPSYMFAGAAVGSVIYLFGGLGGSGNNLNTIVRFNAETHGIETLDVTIPKVNWGTPAVAVGSKIYFFDGTGTAADPALHTFTVHIDLPENHMLIEASGAGNTVRLFPGMEIGVKNVYLGNADGKGEKVPAALYRDGAWTEI